MGRFEKGRPRPAGAGRRRGTPNKKTQDLFEKCESFGVDPFEALLEITKEKDPGLRLSALKEVCSYLYPKRKSIETLEKPGEVDAETFSETSTEQLLELVRREGGG